MGADGENTAGVMLLLSLVELHGPSSALSRLVFQPGSVHFRRHIVHSLMIEPAQLGATPLTALSHLKNNLLAFGTANAMLLIFASVLRSSRSMSWTVDGPNSIRPPAQHPRSKLPARHDH